MTDTSPRIITSELDGTPIAIRGTSTTQGQGIRVNLGALAWTGTAQEGRALAGAILRAASGQEPLDVGQSEGEVAPDKGGGNGHHDERQTAQDA